MLINGVRYKIYLFLQGLQHLQKIPPMETFDEKQLLKAISEGDEKAFKTFFLYYYPRIKGFINGLLQSQEEAEDLSQDIFLTLWNNRSSLHTINNLKPYLFRISKNAVYRHIERTLLFRNYQQKETEKYIPPLESNETDDNIHLKELELLVTMVVEKMPPQRQKIYKMSRESGMNYEAALKSINKIKHPSTKILEAKQDILFQLGTQAFANVKLDDAVSLFSQAIQLGSYNMEARNDAYFWRGESYYRMGEYENAISDYRTYLNNTRQRNTDMYALAYYNLGYSYFKLRDYSAALNRFRQYVDLESNRQAASLADAYNRIGDCLYQNRQFSLAEENYSRAAQLSPSAGDYSIYQKGFLLGLQKDYKGKISAMDRLISEYPESQYVDDALFEKGRSYVLLENSSSAAQAFEKLIREFPLSSLARKAGIQLGLLYYNDNQPEKALAAYKQVISNYPGSEEAKIALQDLKSVYIDLNDINAYASYVNSIGGNIRLEVGEQDSLTYIAAEKLFMRGDNDGARRSLINYLQTFPEGAFSSNANFYLGSIAFAKKEFDEAIQRFKSVIASGDTKFLEESVARTAEIEYLSKDYPAALESFKRLQIVAENPENRQAARLGIMRCALQTGQQKDALLAADELLKEPKLSPELEAEARYVRAKAYIAQKQANKALADLKELSKDTRTVHGAEAKYLLAQLYYDTNDDKNAEKVLMNFIENGTPHQYWLARGFILLADIYIRQGDDFQARQYLTSLQNNYKGDDDIAGMIENRLGKLKN